MATGRSYAARSPLTAVHAGPGLPAGQLDVEIGAEELDGEAPEGVRRPASLEDAFVALTGQETE